MNIGPASTPLSSLSDEPDLRGLESAINLTPASAGSRFTRFVEGTLNDLRAGRLSNGLMKMRSANFARASEADKEVMLRATIAQGVRLANSNAQDAAQATAAVLVVMDLVQNGTVPPDLFGGEHVKAFEDLVNALSTNEEATNIGHRLDELGVPSSIASLARRHNLAHQNLSEAADGVFTSARIDPRYPVNTHRSGYRDLASPAPARSPLATVPSASNASLPAAIASSLQMVQSIEIQLEAAVQTLNQSDSETSQAALARLKAQLDLINAKMDIALSLIDRATGLFAKVGQRFGQS
ncbi:MAG: hypothetical protein AAF449_19065 [Myxococcota bacterium]